ncbi:MAG: alpha/beta hydrolase [Deltaproteobacteria bacterium]|nr:alpha/beta hydrolase [Deltaproteobacteria bacterium]
MPFKTYEIDVEDVEYLRHGNKPLLARMFKPRGNGPFPALVDVHGGAWNLSDRLADTIINEALAKSGVVVAALDFRMPPEASYPASMADINYGVRWLKAHASEYGSRPDLVGIAGSSSGGHQAMLAAMRPRDARYAAIPLPAGASAVDASVRCAIMYWPVIDPLGRYHYAQKLKAGGKPYPEIADWCCRSMTNTGRLRKRWPRAVHCGFWSAASRWRCHRLNIFRAPMTSRIRASISTVSSPVIARPAAMWSWNCSRGWQKASLSASPMRPLQPRRLKKS